MPLPFKVILVWISSMVILENGACSHFSMVTVLPETSHAISSPTITSCCDHYPSLSPGYLEQPPAALCPVPRSPRCHKQHNSTPLHSPIRHTLTNIPVSSLSTKPRASLLLQYLEKCHLNVFGSERQGRDRLVLEF